MIYYQREKTRNLNPNSNYSTLRPRQTDVCNDSDWSILHVS